MWPVLKAKDNRRQPQDDPEIGIIKHILKQLL